MDEIVSLIVANGIFAVLFCGLLVYELKDSRGREDRYQSIIGALNERLKTVEEIRTDTKQIRADVDEIKTDVKILRDGLKPAKKTGGRAQCERMTA